MQNRLASQVCEEHGTGLSGCGSIVLDRDDAGDGLAVIDDDVILPLFHCTQQ